MPKKVVSAENGSGLTYKDGRVYKNGKLFAIGFEEGERIPRASDYKLPKRLSKAQKEMIETTQALFKAIREDYKNGKVRKR
ncbi:MAG: hypothetical protein ACKVRN_02665 [Pyrinomonadaceae bacterium]